MARSRRRLPIVLLSLVLLLAASELVLRFGFGFCDTVLLREDPDFEYIAQPGQDRFRFRHHIRYNGQSMRSDKVDSTAVVILGFGDSVINGGSQTDQDSLATTMLSAALSEAYKRKVQFLNISAGSWGPDNCFAYLKKYGNFHARELWLFVSSHDAYDNMGFEKIVGVDKSFPDRQYRSAIVELFDRYLIPKGKELLHLPQAEESLGISKRTPASRFNSGFDSFAVYAASHHLPLSIYLHADQQELRSGTYNDQGEEIIRFAEAHRLPLIKDLDGGLTAADYRDNIHLNQSGQKHIAALVMQRYNRTASAPVQAQP